MWSKNFCLLLVGRIFTNFADSLYLIAGMWLVYELTQNPFFTGLAGFLISASLVLQFLVGPLVDKWSLKKILIYTQLVQGILLASIPILFYVNLLTVTMVLVIMPILSLIQQFTYPTQHTVLPKIIENDFLVKANSLMTFTYQSLDIVFLVVSGLMMYQFGAIPMLMISCVFFLCTALLYVSIQIPNDVSKAEGINVNEILSDYKQELKEGYSFVKNSFIPKFLVGSIVANFLLGAVTANLPSYAAYRGSESYYAYFLAALSIGLVIGSLLATYLSRWDLGKVTIVGFAVSGVFGVLAVSTSSIALSIVFVGACQIMPGATGILFLSVLQKNVPDEYLGRTFSLINSFTMIAAPIGALIGGIIISLVGSEYLLHLIMISMFFVSSYWLVVPSLRGLPGIAHFDAKRYGLILDEKASM